MPPIFMTVVRICSGLHPPGASVQDGLSIFLRLCSGILQSCIESLVPRIADPQMPAPQANRNSNPPFRALSEVLCTDHEGDRHGSREPFFPLRRAPTRNEEHPSTDVQECIGLAVPSSHRSHRGLVLISKINGTAFSV